MKLAMQLAGIDIEADRLLALSDRLRKVGRDDLADMIQVAHDRDIPIALTPSERKAIAEELASTHDDLADFLTELVRRQGNSAAP